MRKLEIDSDSASEFDSEDSDVEMVGRRRVR